MIFEIAMDVPENEDNKSRIMIAYPAFSQSNRSFESINDNANAPVIVMVRFTAAPAAKPRGIDVAVPVFLDL